LLQEPSHLVLSEYSPVFLRGILRYKSLFKVCSTVFSIETVSFSNSFERSELLENRMPLKSCHFVIFTCQKWLTQIWVSHFTGSFTRLTFNSANFELIKQTEIFIYERIRWLNGLPRDDRLLSLN
jgi:hypothetical protein